jgi:hypothetical protein
MRNVRDQLLLIAVQADRAYTRQRTSEHALAMDLCSDTTLDTPTTNSEHPAVGPTPDNTTGNLPRHTGQPGPAQADTPLRIGKPTYEEQQARSTPSIAGRHVHEASLHRETRALAPGRAHPLTAYIDKHPKTPGKHMRPMNTDDLNDTSALKRQQRLGCNQYLQPQDTAYNEANSKADHKQGHDPYG